MELISSVKDEQKIPYEEKYAHVRPILEEILREHPSYGIPRITPELGDRYGRRINHKVIQQLLHLWDRSMLRKARRPRPSSIRQVILAATYIESMLSDGRSKG